MVDGLVQRPIGYMICFLLHVSRAKLVSTYLNPMKRSTTVELVAVVSVTHAQAREDRYKVWVGEKRLSECVMSVTIQRHPLKGNQSRSVTSGKAT